MKKKIIMNNIIKFLIFFVITYFFIEDKNLIKSLLDSLVMAVVFVLIDIYSFKKNK